MTPGLGAWSFGSYGPSVDYSNARAAAGLRALKAEVIYIAGGNTHGIDEDALIYGSAITARAKYLQGLWKQWPTGRIGHTFAYNLFWTRCVRADLKNKVPGRLTYRVLRLESAHDPVAQGWVDDRDEGGAQIHMPFNPDVTLDEAWNPAFYVPWLSDRLVEAAAYTGDYDGAVAAHNVGHETARLWVKAGKPDSGRLQGTIDWYTRASQYVRLVKGQRTPA